MPALQPGRIVHIATSSTDGNTLYALDQTGALFALEDPDATGDEGPEWVQIATPKGASRVVHMSVMAGIDDAADFLYVLTDGGEVYYLANPVEPEGGWSLLA